MVVAPHDSNEFTREREFMPQQRHKGIGPLEVVNEYGESVDRINGR